MRNRIIQSPGTAPNPRSSPRASFNSIDLYGESVRHEGMEQNRSVFSLKNASGEGRITVYRIFPGFELIYNDLHMGYCRRAQAPVKNVIEINHCRQGRCEYSFGSSVCRLAPGDCSVAPLCRFKTDSCFPMKRYSGITVLIQLDRIQPRLQAMLEFLSIDLSLIRSSVYEKRRCCTIRTCASIEHIFAELYTVPENRKMGYIKVKLLELLLFLCNLENHECAVMCEPCGREQFLLVKQV